MAASPHVLVQDGAGPFINPDNTGDLNYPAGVNVTPGNTVSIKLASADSVGQWTLRVAGTDEDTAIPTLANVDPITHIVSTPSSIVTFTVPAGVAGRAYVFQSMVNNGGPAYTITFGIYTLTASSFRVGAVGERFENDHVFGWTRTLNQFIKRGGGGGGGGVVAYIDGSSIGPFSKLNITGTTTFNTPTLTSDELNLPISPAGTWSAEGNTGVDELQPSEIFPYQNFGLFFDAALGTGNPLGIMTDRMTVRAVSLVSSPSPGNPAHFDGVTLNNADLVLLTRGSLGSNTIYWYVGGILTPYPFIPWMTTGFQVYVREGSIYAGKTFRQTAIASPAPVASFHNQVWKCELGPDIAPPLTTYNGTGGGVTWHTIDTIVGPPADGYDLLVVTDNVATNTGTGDNLQRDRGVVTYHLAGGTLSLSDDSRSLTSANYFRQVVSGNSVQLQVGQQASGNNYSFRVRAWFEYVRSV